MYKYINYPLIKRQSSVWKSLDEFAKIIYNGYFQLFNGACRDGYLISSYRKCPIFTTSGTLCTSNSSQMARMNVAEVFYLGILNMAGESCLRKFSFFFRIGIVSFGHLLFKPNLNEMDFL